jgi:hypothetical protein
MRVADTYSDSFSDACFYRVILMCYNCSYFVLRFIKLLFQLVLEYLALVSEASVPSSSYATSPLQSSSTYTCTPCQYLTYTCRINFSSKAATPPHFSCLFCRASSAADNRGKKLCTSSTVLGQLSCRVVLA